MKRLRKISLLLLTVSLVVGGLYSPGWANDKWAREDPVGQGWSVIDLMLARPIGVVAGIVGTAVFVVTLPFTIPSRGVDDAAHMFIVQPFHFSFIREFPDEDL